MGEVHPFRPRTAVERPAPPSPAAMRAEIEAAALAAMDIANRLIAVLDAMDGDTELEDGGDAEPSLGAPEGHASQVVWLHGSDSDRELSRQDIRS